jgi:hypothetical protein
MIAKALESNEALTKFSIRNSAMKDRGIHSRTECRSDSAGTGPGVQRLQISGARPVYESDRDAQEQQRAAGHRQCE